MAPPSYFILRKLLSDRIHLEFKGGHKFIRLCRVISEILDNKPGFKEVDTLRTILLLEAYLNFTNKLLIGVHKMRVV